MALHSYGHYVKSTTHDDILELCETIRKEDKEEVIASHGDIYTGLMESFSSSDFTETIFTKDDLVAGIYGVSPLGLGIASPWMLSSIYLPEVWREFLRGSREWVKNVNKRYPVLTNCVDAEYELSINWLKFLGFTFINRIENYGVNPKPFLEFVRILED